VRSEIRKSQPAESPKSRAQGPASKAGIDQALPISLTVRNRQRTRKVDLGLLRRIIRSLMEELAFSEASELGIYLVAAPEMTRLNETFLRHQGSTDVITFSYAKETRSAIPLPGRKPETRRARDVSLPCPAVLHGEIFVCIDEALLQARRFRTTWQSELVRYVVHGILHLRGYEDQTSRERRLMKGAEDRLMARLAQRIRFTQLG
jgi:probable rRNA maturation factor